LTRHTIGRVLGESLVIIMSVLLALSADAWWQTRQDDSRRRDYLEGLVIDFDLMSERADSSLAVAGRAYVAGQTLLERLAAGGAPPADSAVTWLAALAQYEVFSPSTGSYESMVASGDLELLGDTELSRQIASFFGSFDDMRVSEESLVFLINELNMSEEYARLAGFHMWAPLWLPGFPSFGDVPVQKWTGSDFLLHAFSRLVLQQGNVILDYRFLRARLDEIGEKLAAVQRSAS